MRYCYGRSAETRVRVGWRDEWVYEIDGCICPSINFIDPINQDVGEVRTVQYSYRTGTRNIKQRTMKVMCVHTRMYTCIWNINLFAKFRHTPNFSQSDKFFNRVEVSHKELCQCFELFTVSGQTLRAASFVLSYYSTIVNSHLI